MFNSLYFFLGLIIVFPDDCYKSIPKSTYFNSCQNWPLSRLADLCRKIPQEATSRINSRSFSSSHYRVTLVNSIEQYDKGDEWM